MQPRSKTCTLCREYLPLELFHRDRHSADGRQGQCKDCQSSRHQGRRVASIAKLLQGWKVAKPE